MISKNAFALILFLVLFYNCAEENTNSETLVETSDVQSQRLAKADISAIKYSEYLLSSNSTTATSNWLQYKELVKYLEDLKKGDLSFISSDPEIISIFLNDMRINIPNSVNTPSIRARLLVLETSIFKANSLLRLKNIKKSEQIIGIKDVLIAMSHFNDQINKKFEIEGNNILRKK